MTTKIPAELSSTPGISDSSNATAITIDSNEKVGIGVATPANYNFGTPLAISAPSGNNSGITIVSATDSNGTVAMADGTSGSEAYKGYLQYSHSSDAMYIGAAGSVVTRFDSDGLKFGSDTAAANALDDYEEGTWTPSLPNGGTVNSLYYATYTKVGRLVTAYVYMNFTATNNSNIFYISGLPYTALNNSGYYAGGSLSYGGTFNFSAFTDPLVLYNTDDIYYHLNSGTNQQVRNSAFGGSAIEWITQVTYMTG